MRPSEKARCDKTIWNKHNIKKKREKISVEHHHISTRATAQRLDCSTTLRIASFVRCKELIGNVSENFQLFQKQHYNRTGLLMCIDTQVVAPAA